MPLLHLNGIFCNEQRGIVQTLESCKHLIDGWDIVDTGSTDETPALIHKCLGNIPGKLHHIPFVDYATTRNAALNLCTAPWALLLSGDEAVTWADREMLHAFLRSSTHAEHQVTINFGHLKFGHVRLVRAAVSGRYSGVTHEVIIPRNQGKRAPLVLRSGRAGEDRTARWKQDRALLEAEAHLGHPRTTFYLAQTYACLGLIDLARDMYIKRIEGEVGYYDEWWEALIRAGNYGGGIKWLVKAIEAKPHRAEPWYYLGVLTNCRELVEKAASLPVPLHDQGFIDLSIPGRAEAWLVANHA